MTHTVLHFVFTASGAGCLVQALRKAGRNDQVIISCDDLSFGPINPSDYASRSKWVENELGQTDRDEMAKPSERDWYEALFPDNRKVAWLTRRSATEYAGFLDWLWRYGDAPCDIVDLTEVEISYPPRRTACPDRRGWRCLLVCFITIPYVTTSCGIWPSRCKRPRAADISIDGSNFARRTRRCALSMAASWCRHRSHFSTRC